jgi:hypothetical protein
MALLDLFSQSHNSHKYISYVILFGKASEKIENSGVLLFSPLVVLSLFRGGKNKTFIKTVCEMNMNLFVSKALLDSPHADYCIFLIYVIIFVNYSFLYVLPKETSNDFKVFKTSR